MVDVIKLNLSNQPLIFSLILERKVILNEQKHIILNKIKKLQESIDYIEQK